MGSISYSYNGRAYHQPRYIAVAGWNNPLEHTPPTSFEEVMQNGGTFVWDDTVPGVFGHGAVPVQQAYAAPHSCGIPNQINPDWAAWTGAKSKWTGGWGTAGTGNAYVQKEFHSWIVMGNTDMKWTGVMPFKLKEPTLARYIAVKLNACAYQTTGACLEYFGLIGSMCPIDGTRHPTPAPSKAPTTAVPSAAPTMSPTRVPASVSLTAPFYAFMACESCTACESVGFAAQIEEILLTMVSDAVVCRVSASLVGTGTDVSYDTNDNSKTLAEHVGAFAGSGYVVTAAGAGGMTLSPTSAPSSSPTTTSPSKAPTSWPTAAP